MMIRLWITIWICLVLMQILTLWISPRFVGTIDLPPDALDGRLLLLAEQTNAMWQLDENRGSTDPVTDAASRNEILMTRESLILQLIELESGLVSRGVDLDIVHELQAYLATMDGSESIPVLNAYISGMIEWIRACSVGRQDAQLERLNLYPGSISGMPVLAFELSGTPELMGEMLLRSSRHDWRLEELDLLMPGEGMKSWIRGSFVFSRNSGT